MNLRLEEKSCEEEKLRRCISGVISGNIMCDKANVDLPDKCWLENYYFISTKSI